jgi:FlaA1/EpsC-like NDP-sugar epimerase
MQRSRSSLHADRLIDDDPRKKNLRLHGVRVLGTIDDLPHLLRDNKPDEIIIAIPSASGDQRRKVVEYARVAGVPVKTLPGLYELISGDVNLAGQLRPVQVEDVLGREPVEVDFEGIASYVRDETVLVTGAGGSIGSELCRQIARVGPKRLILLDHGETALFEIERELVGERGFSAAVPILGDVKNRTKMRQVFERYQPGVVFHAAAYKHVPLMEANPLESVRNNALATRVVAEVAAEFGARRFVLISTDKAVNPKTVMGQSKALCEWIVEAYGHRDDVKTRFVAVRFGNVLGSSGSVIPIFRRQLERGGPLTVTHPR